MAKSPYPYPEHIWLRAETLIKAIADAPSNHDVKMAVAEALFAHEEPNMGKAREADILDLTKDFENARIELARASIVIENVTGPLRGVMCILYLLQNNPGILHETALASAAGYVEKVLDDLQEAVLDSSKIPA